MKYLVLGHRGMVGSAIVRALANRGQVPLTDSGDLTNRSDTDFVIDEETVVFLCAAKVGGIMANMTYPADFIRINLQIAVNVIDECNHRGAKLVFLGSSCIYPKNAPQPIKETALMTGALEPTNAPYALAKIAGIGMCEAYHRQHGFRYLALMPCNLYGPGDNYDLETSHVIPALIRKFHEAKVNNCPSVTVWGSGRPRREFLHVDDMAAAALMLVEGGAEGMVNIGYGKDYMIRTIAKMIASVVGYRGDIVFDASKPDGTMRKLLDISRLMSYYSYRSSRLLNTGIAQTYEAYKETL